MAVATLKFITEDEYLADEELADEKHEYHCGQIFAVAGGTPEQALISSNVIGEMRMLASPRGCKVFTSDLRVRVQATGLK